MSATYIYDELQDLRLSGWKVFPKFDQPFTSFPKGFDEGNF